MFTKAAPARRKQGTAQDPPAWLPDYLASAYEAIAADGAIKTFGICTLHSAHFEVASDHYSPKE